jgi:hypothetical protein
LPTGKEKEGKGVEGVKDEKERGGTMLVRCSQLILNILIASGSGEIEPEKMNSPLHMPPTPTSGVSPASDSPQNGSSRSSEREKSDGDDTLLNDELSMDVEFTSFIYQNNPQETHLNWSTASGIVNENMEKIFLMSKGFSYSHYERKPPKDLGMGVHIYLNVYYSPISPHIDMFT